MKMKKILATLFLAILFQGVAETVVKGTYDTKKKRYTELSQTFEKEINLSYVLPNDKKGTVTYKTENYDILVRKSDLLELYNRKREKKENNIKMLYSRIRWRIRPNIKFMKHSLSYNELHRTPQYTQLS